VRADPGNQQAVPPRCKPQPSSEGRLEASLVFVLVQSARREVDPLPSFRRLARRIEDFRDDHVVLE
jgi:hypothetical protein